MSDPECLPYFTKHIFVKFNDDYIYCSACGTFRHAPDDGMTPIIPPNSTGPWINPFGSGNTWSTPQPDYITCS